MPGDFKKLMVARFFFTFGVQMQAIVLGWRMYELTKDPLYLGFIGLAEAVPALGLALLAGYIVDHSRPLVVYRRVALTSLASAVLMLVTQLKFFGVSENHQIPLLFVSSFLTGAARAFSQPAMFSIVPKLIPRALLPKSSAWMSSAMQTARISGPALGGLLYGFIGVSGTAIFITSFLIITQIALMMISFSPEPNPPGLRKSITQELWLGADFVLKHPLLFPALTMDMISVMFGGVTALLPIYAAEVLFIGPSGLGALRAAPALGAAVMSYILISKDVKKNAGTKLIIGASGFGLCILIFAISKSYLLSLIALILSGAFDSLSMLIRTALVQLASPDHMRGRISAVNSIFIGSSNELGEFESGLAAKLMGAVPAAIFGGIVCISTVFGIAYLSPKLRALDLEELEGR